MKQLQRRGHLGAAAFWVALVGLCWQGANAQQEINALRPPMPIPNVAPPRMANLMPATVPLTRSEPTPIPPAEPIALKPLEIPIPPQRPAMLPVPMPQRPTWLMPATVPMMPARVMLPPPEFDHEYKGRLTILKEPDYSLVQYVCKDVPNAIACNFRTFDSISGATISCLIMLGPLAHENAEVLRHEMGHCNGWPGDHPDAHYD
jgi:hypothetical protein